ncbi:MAG: hypothetical protein ACPGR8_13465 [Limisphaerales bacterium]
MSASAERKQAILRLLESRDGRQRFAEDHVTKDGWLEDSEKEIIELTARITALQRSLKELKAEVERCTESMANVYDTAVSSNEKLKESQHRRSKSRVRGP